MPDVDPLILPFRIRFSGGDADDSKLDFYDGASSLFGFAKTLQLSTHYLINGRVAFQAPSVKGLKLYMLPSQAGSFEQIVQFVFEHPAASILFAKEGVGLVKLSSKIVYDFTKHVLSKTVGRPNKPETEFVNGIDQDHGPDLDALTEALDGPLTEAHRTISRTPSTATVGTPTSNLITFTPQTYDYLKTRIYSKTVERIEGGIAAYNVNSGRGRVWDHELKRTVPFEPDRDQSPKDTTSLSWSLDQRNRGLDGTIELRVRRVLTIGEETKKYLLIDCKRLPAK